MSQDGWTSNPEQFKNAGRQLWTLHEAQPAGLLFPAIAHCQKHPLLMQLAIWPIHFAHGREYRLDLFSAPVWMLRWDGSEKQLVTPQEFLGRRLIDVKVKGVTTAFWFANVGFVFCACSDDEL